MEKIDLKDRKILYELDLDARQSLTQIGKKVGLKKDVVSYRIKRMQKEGIIKNFFTVIDAFKLGYNVFRIYLQFQDIPLEIKNEIISKMVNYKNSWAVYSVIGPFDLGNVLWIKNINEFYQFYDEILDNYSKYIAQKIVSVYVQADEYERTYLLTDEYKKSERKKITITCEGIAVGIDEIDYKLLNEIVLNARTPFIDLAEKLGLSSQTVNYRLNNLIKSGVIKGFRVTLDISKLDLQYFDLRINLSDHSQRKHIINYLKNIPYFKCLNTTIGYSDLEAEFHIDNMDKLNQIIDEINVKFPGSIRNHFYLRTRETHKERWLPEMQF
jgi:Lrp/AsnC family transcriptional regulator for asnA, asnC and gidA